jgi:hypothetical protein
MIKTAFAQSRGWERLPSTLVLELEKGRSVARINKVCYSADQQHVAIAYWEAKPNRYTESKLVVYAQKQEQWQRVGAVIEVKEAEVSSLA